MIRSFLEFHKDRAIQGILTNAIGNCHVRGLTSIMFYNEEGNRLRMFVAEENHELYRNHYTFRPDMTLAIHPHHCDVRLVGVFGNAVNYRVILREKAGGRLKECRYESVISGGKGGLVKTGAEFDAESIHPVPISDVDLAASDLHTVWIPKGEEAAWLVFEGSEWGSYKPLCYTTNPMFDPTGLYQKLDQQQIATVISDVINRL